MPAQQYKLMKRGPMVGAGVTDAFHIGMAAIAKRASPSYPYVIANELICGRLARVVFLPCPPASLMEDAGELFFVSLDFNMSGGQLPPVNAARLLSDYPELCWGIILFDVWVMNGDRHRGNLAYDTTLKRVQVFDHSHAFAGAGGDIASRFTALRNDLAMGQHCLNAISTYFGKDMWIERIQAVPDYFIEGIVEAACSVGLPPSQRSSSIELLKHRRDNLNAIFLNGWAALFSKLPLPNPSSPATVAAPLVAGPTPPVPPLPGAAPAIANPLQPVVTASSAAASSAPIGSDRS